LIFHIPRHLVVLIRRLFGKEAINVSSNLKRSLYLWTIFCQMSAYI